MSSIRSLPDEINLEIFDRMNTLDDMFNGLKTFGTSKIVRIFKDHIGQILGRYNIKRSKGDLYSSLKRSLECIRNGDLNDPWSKASEYIIRTADKSRFIIYSNKACTSTNY